MTYLSEHTTRAIRVDAKLQSLLAHYEEEHENIWPNKVMLLERLKQKQDSDHVLYFVSEQDAAQVEELAKDYPTAIFVHTGYSRHAYNPASLKHISEEFFYKTHPDYWDVVALSQSLRARQTIYFHSTHTNLTTTFPKEELKHD